MKRCMAYKKLPGCRRAVCPPAPISARRGPSTRGCRSRAWSPARASTAKPGARTRSSCRSGHPRNTLNGAYNSHEENYQRLDRCRQTGRLCSAGRRPALHQPTKSRMSRLFVPWSAARRSTKDDAGQKPTTTGSGLGSPPSAYRCRVWGGARTPACRVETHLDTNSKRSHECERCAQECARHNTLPALTDGLRLSVDLLPGQTGLRYTVTNRRIVRGLIAFQAWERGV